MNKKELIKKVAKQTGFFQTDIEQILNESLDAIIDELMRGEKVKISDFGVFSVKMKSARVARNPRTNEPIDIPPRKTMYFSPSKHIKEKIK